MIHAVIQSFNLHIYLIYLKTWLTTVLLQHFKIKAQTDKATAALVLTVINAPSALKVRTVCICEKKMCKTRFRLSESGSELDLDKPPGHC